MAINMLSEVKVRQAKGGPKPVKMFDGGGLYLFVTKAGAKSWRIKFGFAGREHEMVIGQYPAVSLADAREARDRAKADIARGVDPRLSKLMARVASASDQVTFEQAAREWRDRVAPTLSEGHVNRIMRRLEVDVFPWLGKLPLSQIEPPMILACCRRVEQRGAIETAHRALTNVGQVFRYAVACGYCKSNPARDLSAALTPVVPEHYAAVIDPAGVAKVLQAINGYHGSPVVRAALQLGPLTFVRPGELRQALWSGIDLEAAEWNLETLKTKQRHVVPLSRQAVAILAELLPLTGDGRWVFPSYRIGSDRPMSNNAVLVALRSLGISGDVMTGHGWRATARTMLAEVLRFPEHLIEHQLGHAVRDPLGRAYNRATHLEERREMMQRWADYLDEIAASS